MNKDALLRKIRQSARQDESNRQDQRFLDTLGFLVAKGFLKTNIPVRRLPNKRLRIDDAIWAGMNAEPRILEVLPAAVLRLGGHFDLDSEKHPELARTVERLRRGEEHGDPFFGIPFEKLGVWVKFALRDKRVKPLTRKKVLKTFRLNPRAIERLREIARNSGTSETSALENLLMSAPPKL